MCKCVRDADRLDSLKPHYTVNDVSSDINIGRGAVDLSCTRFKTRIRRSPTQVRLILSTIPTSYLIGMSGLVSSDGNILYGCSTSGSRPTKARSRDA